MLDKYLSPAQVADTLSISKRQAYNIMYQMPYLPGPLRVSERALRDWIDKNTVYPMGKSGRRTA